MTKKKAFSVKKGSISFVMLVSLIVVCTGATVSALALSGKFSAKSEYNRIANRYINESGIELAVGLFLNYLSNQDYTVAYTKTPDGSYSVSDNYAPYLLDEIRLADNADTVSIDLVAIESADYLSAVGFLDFAREKGIEVSLSTFCDKDNFKLSRMCIEPDFLVSLTEETADKSSRINPVYLNIKTKYKGGEVLCSMKISDLYVVRKPFYELAVGETGSVSAEIDTKKTKVSYENYQNYRRTGR